MSGTTTLLGVALARGDRRGVAGLWGVLIAFSLGAMGSGPFVQDSTLRYHALLIPAALTGLTGVGYAAYRHRTLLRLRENAPASASVEPPTEPIRRPSHVANPAA